MHLKQYCFISNSLFGNKYKQTSNHAPHVQVVERKQSHVTTAFISHPGRHK